MSLLKEEGHEKSHPKRGGSHSRGNMIRSRTYSIRKCPFLHRLWLTLKNKTKPCNDSLLHVYCKMVEANGTDIDDGMQVALTKLSAVGDHLITNTKSYHCSSYRALIEVILTYARDPQGTPFAARGFSKDDFAWRISC